MSSYSCSEVAFFICRPAIAELDSQQQLTATEGPAGKKGSPAKEGALDSHAICAVLPTATWNVLSPRLYATFWSLSLYDIFVPKQRYEAETRRLKKHVEETGQRRADAPDDFVAAHGGLWRYDMQLFELAHELFEELLDRHPVCRQGQRPSRTTAARDRVLRRAGIDPSEAAQCGWRK